jgi:hypothetical protein
MSQLCCSVWRDKCSDMWVCLIALLDDSVMHVLLPMVPRL